VVLVVDDAEDGGGLWFCMSYLSGGVAEAFIWLVEILSTAVVSSSSLLLGLGWAWGWSAGFLLGACHRRRLGGVVVLRLEAGAVHRGVSVGG
jgi:hypothetical protein